MLLGPLNWYPGFWVNAGYLVFVDWLYACSGIDWLEWFCAGMRF